ncbi:hypothetical protein FB451DRAFT_1262722, partial [Mycena latifolia]
MAGNVPDEIIHEILCPALRVPDEAFSATSHDSPFVSVVESSSAFLLVSKSWLRVGTPLLYNVVIIRSKAQAQALAIVLRSNPDLGRSIKKLRVEGGYAISMHKILQASKNITDLFITLDIAKFDNACGLCRGLPLIEPVRCIQKWKNLTVFDITHLMDGSPSLSSIYHALKNAKSLNTLIISDSDASLFQESEVPRYILTIAANLSLQHIRPKPRPTRDVTESEFFQALQQHGRLQALFELPPPLIEPPTIPFVYPAQLAADPEVEDRIWRQVLYYVMDHGDIASRYYSLVRRLSITHPGGDQFVARMIARALTLVELVCTTFTVTWKVFNDICNMAGSTLRTVQVSVAKPTTPVSPDIFSQLPGLRCFTWDSEIVFKTDLDLISGGAFDGLVDLSIEAFDSTFLTVLTHMEWLPSLRNVIFSAKSTGGNFFFEKHGKKLLELTVSVPQIDSHTPILRHCPSLTSVPRKLTGKHACLERITFRPPLYF